MRLPPRLAVHSASLLLFTVASYGAYTTVEQHPAGSRTAASQDGARAAAALPTT